MALHQSQILQQEKLWHSVQFVLNVPMESSMAPKLEELQAQVKQLQMRIVGKGVKIADKVFQSFDGICMWVATYLLIQTLPLQKLFQLWLVPSDGIAMMVIQD